mmetsp:Transcript_2752/g.11318  ORF Transcript_2752/g.11318 Transcript_2752/m.11318 type:complete len:203 (+) Transcript_2752:346-954(+)
MSPDCKAAMMASSPLLLFRRAGASSGTSSKGTCGCGKGCSACRKEKLCGAKWPFISGGGPRGGCGRCSVVVAPTAEISAPSPSSSKCPVRFSAPPLSIVSRGPFGADAIAFRRAKGRSSSSLSLSLSSDEELWSTFLEASGADLCACGIFAMAALSAPDCVRAPCSTPTPDLRFSPSASRDLAIVEALRKANGRSSSSSSLS